MAESIIPQRLVPGLTMTEQLLNEKMITSIFTEKINVLENGAWIWKNVDTHILDDDSVYNSMIKRDAYEVSVGNLGLSKIPADIRSVIKTKKLQLSTEKTGIIVSNKDIFTPLGTAVFLDQLGKQAENMESLKQYSVVAQMIAGAKTLMSTEDECSKVSAEERLNNHFRLAGYIQKARLDPKIINPFINLGIEVSNVATTYGYVWRRTGALYDSQISKSILATQNYNIQGKKTDENQALNGLVEYPGLDVIEVNPAISRTQGISFPTTTMTQYGSYGIIPKGKNVQVYDTDHDRWAELPAGFEMTGLFDDKGWLKKTLKSNEFFFADGKPKKFIGELAHGKDKFRNVIEPNYLIQAAIQVAEAYEKQNAEARMALEQGMSLMNRYNNQPEADYTANVAEAEKAGAEPQIVEREIKSAAQKLKQTNGFVSIANTAGCGSVMGFEKLATTDILKANPIEQKTIVDFLYHYKNLFKEIKKAVSGSLLLEEKMVYGFLDKEWVLDRLFFVANPNRPTFVVAKVGGTDTIFPLTIDQKSTAATKMTAMQEKGDKFISLYPDQPAERQVNLNMLFEKQLPKQDIGTYAENITNLNTVFEKVKEQYKDLSIIAKLVFVSYMYGYLNANTLNSMQKAGWPMPLYLMFFKPNCIVQGSNITMFDRAEKIGTVYTTKNPYFTKIDRSVEGKMKITFEMKFAATTKPRTFVVENGSFMKYTSGDGIQVYDPEQMKKDKNYYNPNIKIYGKTPTGERTKSMFMWAVSPNDYNEFMKNNPTLCIQSDFHYVRDVLGINVPSDMNNMRLSFFDDLNEIWKFNDIKSNLDPMCPVNTILRATTFIIDDVLIEGNDWNGELLKSKENGLNKRRFLYPQ